MLGRDESLRKRRNLRRRNRRHPGEEAQKNRRAGDGDGFMTNGLEEQITIEITHADAA